MSFKGFQSPRLFMKPVHRKLAQSLFPLLNDQALYQYLPDQPLTLEALEKRFTFWELGISPDQSEYWLNWVLQSKANEQFIGTIQAGIDRDSKVATIAYIIGSDFQQKGYATEAISALFTVLKEEYQVRQTKAWIDTRNLPSIRLVEKLGFKQIEFIESADYFKGSQSDEFVYCLTF